MMYVFTLIECQQREQQVDLRLLLEWDESKRKWIIKILTKRSNSIGFGQENE